MLSLTNYGIADFAVIKLLKFLGIGIDAKLITSELEKHPDYPSLLAISDVLTNFNIENNAFRVDFDELDNEICPFMAHTNVQGNEYLVVSRIEGEDIIVSGKKWNRYKLNTEEFKNMYTGVILTAEPGTSESNTKGASAIPVAVAITILGFAFILALVFNSAYFSALSWQIIALTLFKSVGLVISILLLVQSIDNNNPLVQRLCQTGGKKTDCNAILSSKAAKVFDWLSWSEVGFFYFAGTWLLILFGGNSPLIWKTLLLLNIVSLPYTFYSIYYQARVAKQWCVLCCTVQGLLWFEFIPLLDLNLPLSFHAVVNLKVISTITISLFVPVGFWTLSKPLCLKLQQFQPLKEQLRKFKYNSEIFTTMLAKQPKYALPEAEWSLTLGNKEAKHVITVVTNPYCSPCAKMHLLLDELLGQRVDLQARIVFTANNTDEDIKTPVSRHLMALSELPDKSIVRRALHDWYDQKQKNYHEWAKVYPVQLNEANFRKLDKQLTWTKMVEVTGTPTLFLDGYLIPAMYKLPDLKYMLD